MKTSLYISAALAIVSVLSGCADEPNGFGALGFGSGSGSSSGSGAGEPTATVAFRPDIQADLDEIGCSSGNCHGGTALPMPVTANPSDDADWNENYQQVKQRSGSVSASLLMDKAVGDGGHIAPMDPEGETAQRWLTWIEQGAPYELGGGGAGGAGAGGSSSSGSGGSGGSGPPPVGELTWDNDIYPLIVANACHDCHGSSGWQGAYSLASYQAALGYGTDSTPNVVPGDASSKLIEYTSAGHKGMASSDALIIETWIMDWEAQE
jgi:hypothetical protein